ncbi:MAG: ACT domain-containing protein [Deltaproteobacteria bacterium]|nr:ACT domain-containing protein [Deltaproteobacteria bacterium]MBN2687074.1 ACT domain-containing protein [Deltaproteobacteria bacterium]
MLISASMTKEIMLTVANKPGMLNTIVAFLANRGINIEGVVGLGMKDKNTAITLMVVDDTRRAMDALKDGNIGYAAERDAIMLEIRNRPGALLSITKILAQIGINIDHIYATKSSVDAPARVILSTNDNERTYVALKRAVSVDEG